MMKYRYSGFFTGIVLVSMLVVSISHAEVEYDGSINASGFVPGPNYIIDSSFGQQSGRNLFHSFKNFNIGSGENARFVGSSDVSQIFARVTSGNSSVINGLVASDIDGASLWLINPKGIIFGQGAALDISGSFYATTANSIAFEDGRFDSIPAETDTLPGGVVQRVEMLYDNPASIYVHNSSLKNEQGNGVYFISKNMSLMNTQLDENQIISDSFTNIENITIDYTGGNEVTRIQTETATLDVGSASGPVIEAQGNLQTVEKDVVQDVVQEEPGQGGVSEAGLDQILFTANPSMDQKSMEDKAVCGTDGEVISRNSNVSSNTGTWFHPMGGYVSFSTYQSRSNRENGCR